MSGSGERSAADLAGYGAPLARKVAGMVRRFLVEFSFSSIPAHKITGIWQLRGFRELKEVVKLEVFQGIGIWARPPKSGKQPHVEAIAVSVGDSDNQVVIATRDEKTRKALALALDVVEDETILHNTQAVVAIRADGTIQARSYGGTAVPLATLADLQALRDWIGSTMIIATPAGNSTPGTTVDPPTPAGTTVLKGE